MEAFSALLALCEGNPTVTGGFPHKGQWRRALMFSLIFTWTNGWANNPNTRDLRCHCTHYDISAKSDTKILISSSWNGGARVLPGGKVNNCHISVCTNQRKCLYIFPRIYSAYSWWTVDIYIFQTKENFWTLLTPHWSNKALSQHQESMYLQTLAKPLLSLGHG